MMPPMPPSSRGNTAHAANNLPVEKAAEGPVREDESLARQTSDGSLGWSAVAKGIAAWTSRLLVSLLIAAATVAFASQVLRWWRDSASGRSPPASSLAADNGNVVEWVAADWTTTLYTASGPEEEVTRDLAQRLLKAAADASFPGEPPSEKERSVLRGLVSRDPVIKTDDGLAVYRLNQALPIWLATRVDQQSRDSSHQGIPSDSGTARHEPVRGPSKPGGGPPTPISHSGTARRGPARGGDGKRIVAWAFAIPVENELWRVALAASGLKDPKDRGLAAEIPLPPDAELAFTMRLGGGTMLRAFRGRHVDRIAWMAHFDTWLETRGWSAGSKWLIRDGEARRTFRRPEPATEFATEKFVMIVLQEEATATRGLIMQEATTNRSAAPGD